MNDNIADTYHELIRFLNLEGAGLYAMTFSDNKTMIKLFRKLPYKVSNRYEDGDLMMNARFSEPNE